MATEKISANNKRIAKNTILLYIRMFVTMCVSFYTSRVILQVLGVDDFGLYNIVGGIVVLFSILNGALSSSTQRFLNYEIGKIITTMLLLYLKTRYHFIWFYW